MRFHRLTSQIVHRNPWYAVRRDEVTRPDGSPGEYYVIERPASVFIVPSDDRGRIVLIRLHRYPTGVEGWEVPAGGVDADSPLEAARRELREETGLRAASWTQIGRFQAMNGLSDEMSHVYAASDLSPAGSHERHDEGIVAVEAFVWGDVERMVRDGDITDSQSVAALMLAAVHQRRLAEPGS